MAQFPQTLEAFVEGEENGIQIPVVWECEGDYADEEVTEFWFRPVLIDEEYELGGVELPGICVVVGSKIMMMAMAQGASVIMVSVDGAETGCDSLAEAVELVNNASSNGAILTIADGTVLTLEEDLTMSKSFTIKAEGNVTLDLNGRTIEEVDCQIVIGSGNVTIEGDGILNSAGPSKEDKAPSLIVVEEGAGLTLDGVDMNVERSAVASAGNLTVSSVTIESKYYGLELLSGGATIIGEPGADNGKITVTAARSAVMGENRMMIVDANAEIYSGTFVSKGDQKGHGTVYWHSTGTLSIYGGEFSALQPEGGGNYGAGLLQKAGTLQVYGGTFTGMNGIYFNALNNKKMTTKLMGGSFVGNEYAIYVNSSQAKYYSSMNLRIENNGVIKPSFTSINKGSIIYQNKTTSTANKYLESSIYGGIFNKEPDPKYLAPGLMPTTVDGQFVIETQTEGNVQVIKDDDIKYFDNLPGAVAALTGGETIKLLADCSLLASIELYKKNVIIDLNGHKCKFTNEKGMLQVKGGNVTFTDTSSEGNGKLTAPWYGIMINQGANVSLDTITVEAGMQAVSVGVEKENSGQNTFRMTSGSLIADSCGVSVWKNATFEMSGGTVTGNEGYGIAGNGSHDGTNILISGDAVVKSGTGDCPAIFHPQEGNLTITGGTIEGGSGVQYCGAGDINISGGTLIAHASYSEFPFKTPDEGDGSAVDGAALSLISRGDGYQGDGKTMNVTISGGEFISDSNAAISVYRLEKKGNNWITNDKTSVSNYLGSLTITEGKFRGRGQKPALEIDPAVPQGVVSISGGLYSDDGEWPYLAPNYTIVPEDNMFRVTLKETEIITDAEGTGNLIEVSDIVVGGADDQKKKKAAEVAVGNLAQELTGNAAVNGAAIVGLETAFKKDEFKNGNEWDNDTTLVVLSIKPALVDIEATAEFGTPDASGNVTAVLNVTKLVFNVEPYVTLKNQAGDVLLRKPISNDYLNRTTPIHFRLPIPASIDANRAKVIHISDFEPESFYANILGEGDQKYIEISVTHFSRFEVIFEKTTEYVPENNGSDDSDDDDDDGGTGSLTGCWIRDAKGWWFKYSNGSYPRDGWAYLYYGNRYGWYHFNKEGYMDTGWFTDLDGREYYLNPVSDGYQGIMLTGWVRIGDPWFYFHTRTGGPLGSLVKGTRTPDGYLVDEKGRWIQ